MAQAALLTIIIHECHVLTSGWVDLAGVYYRMDVQARIPGTTAATPSSMATLAIYFSAQQCGCQSNSGDATKICDYSTVQSNHTVAFACEDIVHTDYDYGGQPWAGPDISH
jgi:hypothetical protein